MSTTKNPKVTVLMTVYNAEEYLDEAIQSILRQDFADFEFLIINDGSSDKSQDILDRYIAIDKRIKIINQKNIGLVASLNKGVRLARGKYIARMDSDDISMSKRLSRQVIFLNSHPKVMLVGGCFEIIDEEGNFLDRVFTPLNDRDIRRSFLMKNVFGHASVMYRRDAVLQAGGYSDQVGPTEDLELWMRLSQKGQIAALPYCLMRYRINRNGISNTKSEQQMRFTQQLLAQYRQQNPFQVLSRQTIKKTARAYLESGPGLFFGVGLKMTFLLDNAQLGVKMIRYRHPLKGLRQLFNVASIGRSGVRAVRIRLRHLGTSSFRLAVISEPSLESTKQVNDSERDLLKTKVNLSD